MPLYKGVHCLAPHQRPRQFGKDWGFQKVLYELADEKITKVAEVYQLYLTDTLTFLTYLIKKGEVEEKEEAYQESSRKAMRK